MRKSLNIFLIVITLLLIGNSLVSCKTQKIMIDNTVVKDLDIQKYLGTWYEIARYNHSFERGLVGVTANYSFRKDGKIKVVNSGYKNSFDGKFSQAVGKAKIPDPINDPAKLKVSFFLFFYGDYYVMELDKDYQWAVIGSSSDKYLWILSRKPQMEKELYNELLDKLQKRGYDVSKLIKVKQKKS
jgi:apolipoprotein D and lipocalin family protein